MTVFLLKFSFELGQGFHYTISIKELPYMIKYYKKTFNQPKYVYCTKWFVKM